jgi:hypothetical protein
MTVEQAQSKSGWDETRTNYDVLRPGCAKADR